ncbi:MAG: methyltransferase domain-containing protein [Blastocatellia bacterium]|nr:methyltransferase domain-containing protein [Blastocatellia bacterium]
MRTACLWSFVLVLGLTIFTPAQGKKKAPAQSGKPPATASKTAPQTVLPTAPKVSFLPFDAAQPILYTMHDVLPPTMRVKGPQELSFYWPIWTTKYNNEIRTRLVQGDEDTLINFLLFGTTFTKQPRLTEKDLNALVQPAGEQTSGPAFNSTLLNARIGDLLTGLVTPGTNERLLFLRKLVEQKGYTVDASAESRKALQEYFVGNLSRVLQEKVFYNQTIANARQYGDPSLELAERSKLFKDRGLSLDTSLRPDYAIEESLKAIGEKKIFLPNSIRRIAVIGPGLDFTDKQEGYDFYPQQTIQPFAIFDSLLRLGLAEPKSMRMTILDLSPRILDHVERTATAGRKGTPYTVNLPYDTEAAWKAEFVKYWEHFGDKIGTPAQAVSAPGNLKTVKVRAVQIRPDYAARLNTADVNIVLQHTELPEDEKYDLIVATNILVYYDTFEQSLALANIERMLKPGGLLLSNNALLELPSSKMRSVGYLTVVYSDRDDDGDHIIWYQKK